MAGTSELSETPPHLSRNKQARINIWRSEVAALTAPPSSSVSTSNSSSSSSSTSSSESRGRQLWRRLKSKLAKRSEEPERIRTEMYASHRLGVEGLPRREEATDVPLGEEFSDGGDGLKEKQERLERAARLLNQGTVLQAMGG